MNVIIKKGHKCVSLFLCEVIQLGLNDSKLNITSEADGKLII